VIQFIYETDRELFESAIRFAQKQVKRLIETQPDYYPMYTMSGVWKHDGPALAHWCDGFLPGIMWLFYKRLGPNTPDSRFWWEHAIQYSRPLEARKSEPDVHDIGFIFLTAYYRWYQCTRDDALVSVMVQAGKTLAEGFDEKGQYLRSLIDGDSVYIDIMMNVGIVFYAARETNDKRLRDIATRHALTTRKHLVRGDGSTAQEGIFDVETGEFLRQVSQQGYRSDSCWARGLCWALYGFNTAYEYSRDPRFLHTAEACADYYISHSSSDGIPPWDYNAPSESRKVVDTSAAAIAAAGLLRLCRHIADPMKGHFYWSTAIHILRSLCTKYLASADPDWQGVLKGAVYHIHKGLGVDESAIWGEYYFVEALEEALRVMGHTIGHATVN
jgi:unsaturated chondroitin disaccharide hydrolase